MKENPIEEGGVKKDENVFQRLEQDDKKEEKSKEFNKIKGPFLRPIKPALSESKRDKKILNKIFISLINKYDYGTNIWLITRIKRRDSTNKSSPWKIRQVD